MNNLVFYDGSDYFSHYGVKGMKWGVRKDKARASRDRRRARRDANEYAKAKMAYGEGAGIRRRHINQTVKTRAAASPAYKSEFDRRLANQDWTKRARQAKRRGDLRYLTEGASYGVTSAVVAVGTGYAIAKQTGADKVIMRYGKESLEYVKKRIG